jgi:hypothetical protein
MRASGTYDSRRVQRGGDDTSWKKAITTGEEDGTKSLRSKRRRMLE